MFGRQKTSLVSALRSFAVAGIAVFFATCLGATDASAAFSFDADKYFRTPSQRNVMSSQGDFSWALDGGTGIDYAKSPSGMGATSPANPGRPPVKTPVLDSPFDLPFALADRPLGSCSGTTGSTLTDGGSSSSAVQILTAPQVPPDTLQAALATESGIILPDSPISSLFRPPRSR